MALSSALGGCARCGTDAEPPVPGQGAASEPAAPVAQGRSADGAAASAERRSCADSALGALRLRAVATGLSQPLYVLSEPGVAQRLYVLEKGGDVKRVVDGQTTTLLSLDVETDIEMGLLGMAFHPRFGPDERRVYLSYVDPKGRSTVSAFRLEETRIDGSSEHVLLRVEQPAANHNGGMIAFGPDGLLYVGLGDGGGRDDRFGNGQNRGTPLGTIVRLDVETPDRRIEGNLSGDGVDPRVFHFGLRNPWRFSFDAKTGDLYIADVGQNHWEELNVLPRDAGSTNFGWPTYEGSRRCPGCKTNVPEPSPDMKMPVHEYPRGAAASVTGGYVYRGEKIPSLRGRYLYSDFVQSWVRAFTWDGRRACDHKDLTAALDAEGKLQGVASFGEDSDQELYVVSFVSGEVFRIEPGSGGDR